MERFHMLEWPQRPLVIGQLADGRLRTMGQRLLYVEAPELMDDAARHEYDAAIAHRLMAGVGRMPWVTYPQALVEIDEMIAAAVGAEATRLSGHRDYLRERATWANSLLV